MDFVRRSLHVGVKESDCGISKLHSRSNLELDLWCLILVGRRGTSEVGVMSSFFKLPRVAYRVLLEKPALQSISLKLESTDLTCLLVVARPSSV